jgi:hypothetical protein
MWLLESQLTFRDVDFFFDAQAKVITIRAITSRLLRLGLLLML